ncbi:MAG: response regulator transcription factor [Rhodocyclaceae bacterium]|jgi:DNA-binding NarL/FixJ family response regulator|nr:response regulator transcription factor [Rhodocyclaceae bacterium]MBK6908220.1 response regulator transcription factor [Rhodocyclaceae bacterium]
MIHILLADDHTLFRAGLRQMLGSYLDLVVVAEAASAQATLSMVSASEAQLLICDLTMPGASGTSLIEAVRRVRPNLPILVLSMHDEPTTIRRALQAGATGYLTKESSPDTLHEAVLKVATGHRFIPAALAEQMAFASATPAMVPHDALSEREREVFRLIAQGTPLSHIAEQLHLSPKTITTHKTHLMEKLGVENNAELIRYALERRLFE